jgi:hypothetical protein
MQEQGELLKDLEEEWQQVDTGTLTSPQQLEDHLTNIKVRTKPLILVTIKVPCM